MSLRMQSQKDLVRRGTSPIGSTASTLTSPWSRGEMTFFPSARSSESADPRAGSAGATPLPFVEISSLQLITVVDRSEVPAVLERRTNVVVRLC